MRRFSILLLFLFCSFSSAQAQGMGPKESTGTFSGAVLGGAIGSMFGGDAAGRIVGGLAGAAIGGMIGNRIGASLDEEDQRRLAQATRQAMSSGGASKFSNSRTGVKGSARVTKTSKNPSGQTCRTVTQEVVLKNGSVSRDTVTGCKGLNGWSV